MVIYVAHEYGGKQENIDKVKQILCELQTDDLDNTYISPLTAFSHIIYNSIGYDEEMELCYDLLSVCDMLYVASDISEGVQREIDFAKLIEMPIEYI